MIKGYSITLYIILLSAGVCFGQNRTRNKQVQLPVPPNIQRAFKAGTRDKSGAPGIRYWQNREDYQINIHFNPVTRQIDGTVGIDFFNNSPDTLTRILFKLFPNLYQTEAPRTIPIAESDLTGGVMIKAIRVDNRLLDSTQHVIRGTNMSVRGQPVLPHQRVHYDLAYSYTLNKGSFVRTGQIDSGAFFIAYFFPRLSVYDDIDGWNLYPYTGQYEFYNDFCHFNAEITVPGDYQVWGTGDLKNPEEVYTAKFVDRIRRAGESDTVINIITEADLKTGNVTQQNNINTWKFEADQVTDMAFGLSNHYVWKAASLVVDSQSHRRTRVDAVFNPEHKSYLPIIRYALKTTDIISYQFPGLPFPYSHETVFDGPDEMEFPMMVDNKPFDKPADAIELTAHEIFHTLFPFYVGTNETKYSFMDEGWATLAEFLLQPVIDSTVPEHYDIGDVNNSAGSEQDLPIITLTPQLAGSARYADKDLKPALGYLYLKEMLGERLFFKALNEYIREWQGKHPTPYDFFHCMNTASGEDLNWFWKDWFFEKGIPDLAIVKVSHKNRDYSVVIGNLGTESVPVHLTVLYEDGTAQSLGTSAAVWSKGNKTTTLTFKATKKIRQLSLGTAYDADANKQNNTWTPQ